MTNLTERVARLHCALDGVGPDSSLGGDGQNFLWMEYAETHAKPALTEIFNYLENPSEAAIADGKQYVRAEDDAMGWAWEAMLAQFKKEALGK